MNHRRLLPGMLIWALLLCLPVSAAERPVLQSAKDATQDDGYGRMILEANLDAADALVESLEGRELPKYTILPMPLASMDSPGQTTPMGRLVTQQVASRFAQHGFPVIATDFGVQQEAQMNQDMTTARTALTGYYQGGRELFISLRLVRLQDNVVLAAYEYVLPQNSAVRRLMINRSLQETWGAYAGRRPALASTASAESQAVPAMQSTGFPALAGEAELMH